MKLNLSDKNIHIGAIATFYMFSGCRFIDGSCCL